MEHPEVKKVLKFTTALVFILCLFLAAKIIGEVKAYRFIGSGEIPQNVITVSGRGEVFAAPDLLSFSFTVSEEADTVSEAQNKATAKINAAIAILRKHDIEEKDIQTTGYNINPRYSYHADDRICPSWGCPPAEPYISGYEVSQTISVKVRKTEGASQIITDLGGVALSYLSGLTFEIDDMDAVKAKARKLAIENAREKMETLAEDLDVKVVRLVSFSEQENGYYPPMPFGERDMAMAEEQKGVAPEIPAGENEIVSYVSVTYEIR